MISKYYGISLTFMQIYHIINCTNVEFYQVYYRK